MSPDKDYRPPIEIRRTPFSTSGSYKDLRCYSIDVGGLKTLLKHGVVSGVGDANALAMIHGQGEN